MLTKRAVGFARTLGFTIIEMGIVLVIIGLVSGAAISILGPIGDGRKAELTNQHLDVIQKALQVYVIQNGCLPCPTDGTQASVPANVNVGKSMTVGSVLVAGTCAAAACLKAAAVVPWVTLGISEEDITDGWGDRIRYGVAGSQVTASTCTLPVAGALQLTNGMVRTPGASGCYPQGNLTVDDIDNTAVSEPDMQQAAYVLVSSGADKALALRAKTGASTGNRWTQAGTDAQFVNSDGDDAYALGIVNANSDHTHFDDITRFDTAPIMIQLCGAGACGNPS